MANARERAAFSAGDDKVQIRKRITVKIMLKLTAYVSGKVQMAGYRSKIVTIARVFGLKGYVMNLPDSRVKIVAEGHEADLERFLEAVRIKNTLIDVEEIKADFSEANGSYEEFFKIAGEGETDARLDQAAEYLKELISAVREGFKDNGSKLDSMSSSLKDISGKQDDLKKSITEGFRETGSYLKDISGKQDDLKKSITEGFRETGSYLKDISGKQDDLKKSITEGFRETGSSLKDISGKQDQIIDRIDCAREEIVSEVSGMRSDLKGRTEERLQRIESDVTEIKARMRS